ncbi:pentapeptide repeat-containing protein [Rathayibacter soli]|uniref:pentapeptide repeat-containing protein n=1 Tax=Rathayibacter soli TaxID=3144168 RepID=UPI0027E417BA|nr:pentapeptide repeat-containing protein [Glaciibacter superstes]
MTARSTTAAPRITTVRLPELASGDVRDLDYDVSVDAESCRDADLAGRNLAGSTFSDCEFIDVTLDDADLRAARFNDCRLTRMNAPVLKASRSSWRGVEVIQSRVGSGELYDSGLNAVLFSHCKIGYLNLRGSTLRDVLFSDCTIDELDLGGAKATRVAFADSSIRLLDATHATFADLDVRGAELRGIRGIDNLRGTTMTEYQLAELSPLFAAHLGITIE